MIVLNVKLRDKELEAEEMRKPVVEVGEGCNIVLSEDEYHILMLAPNSACTAT